MKNKWMLMLVILSVGIFCGLGQVCDACTTILVGKKATADGSVIHAHNEDMGFSAVGRLWRVTAAVHDRTDSIQVPYVAIPQPEKTYGYWATGNAFVTKGLGISETQQVYDNVLVGLNEWGVSLSCNWMWSKENNIPQKGIRRYAIRQLVLERAKTAKEAVRIIGDFIDTYGQADWGGLGYCIADPHEAWIVETTTHHWVARKIADDETLVVANRFTIGSDYDLASGNLQSFAREKGWTAGAESFSFRNTYGREDRMNQAYDTDREGRVMELLGNKKGRIGPEDLFRVLRDRFEGSKKYVRPLKEENWRDYSEANNIPRSISTNLCQSSTVFHLRADLPVSIGAVMWFTMGPPQYTNYFPIYAGAMSIPKSYDRTDAAISQDSAWWISRLLQREVDKDYDRYYPKIKKKRSDAYHKIAEKKKNLEQMLSEQIKDNKAVEIDRLSQFSYETAEDTWHLAHTQCMQLQKK